MNRVQLNRHSASLPRELGGRAFERAKRSQELAMLLDVVGHNRSLDGHVARPDGDAARRRPNPLVFGTLDTVSSVARAPATPLGAALLCTSSYFSNLPEMCLGACDQRTEMPEPGDDARRPIPNG